MVIYSNRENLKGRRDYVLFTFIRETQRSKKTFKSYIKSFLTLICLSGLQYNILSMQKTKCQSSLPHMRKGYDYGTRTFITDKDIQKLNIAAVAYNRTLPF